LTGENYLPSEVDNLNFEVLTLDPPRITQNQEEMITEDEWASILGSAEPAPLSNSIIPHVPEEYYEMVDERAFDALPDYIGFDVQVEDEEGWRPLPISVLLTDEERAREEQRILGEEMERLRKEREELEMELEKEKEEIRREEEEKERERERERREGEEMVRELRRERARLEALSRQEEEERAAEMRGMWSLIEEQDQLFDQMIKDNQKESYYSSAQEEEDDKVAQRQLRELEALNRQMDEREKRDREEEKRMREKQARWSRRERREQRRMQEERKKRKK